MAASTGFRALKLGTRYRSSDHEILGDFYVPCLSCAVSYDRAVGYFTSKSLQVAARGLEAFREKGGMVRIVASAQVSELDAQAMSVGYSLRGGERKELPEHIVDALNKEIATLDDRVTPALQLLAWLIAEGTLDMMIAVPTRPGIYHEKFGYFVDADAQVVAFQGSPNETEEGLVSNFECIEVYQNGFGDREDKRIAKMRRDFELLWNNQTPNLVVYPFPAALRNAILQYRPKEKPKSSLPTATGPGRVAGLVPWPYQEEAIQAWFKNGRRGILRMATGSGKTLVALESVRRLTGLGYLIVVCVPTIDLIHQWKDEIQSQYPNADSLLVLSQAVDWFDRLKSFAATSRIIFERLSSGVESSSDPRFIVLTAASLSQPRVLNLFHALGLDGNMVLVGDEVHGLGAEQRSRILSLNALGGRLGLSATPERLWDEVGTSKIEEYFGGVIYDYPLNRAIQEGRLTPYNYYIHSVKLLKSEMEDYREISRKMAKAFHTLTSTRAEEAETALEQLAFARSRIIKKAARKLEIVDGIVADRKKWQLGKTLIYCNDEQQVDAVSKILQSERLDYGTFTSGRLTGTQRSLALDLFEKGALQFLVAIKCLDEGIDVPSCDTAIVLASSQNSREFIQRRGRVLRRAPGKQLATIHDVLVLPDLSSWNVDEKGAELRLLGKEFERAELFADSAKNRPECYLALHRIRRFVVAGENGRSSRENS